MTRADLQAWFGERRSVFAWWVGSRLLVFATVLVLTWVQAPRGFFSTGTFAGPLQPLGSWDGRWYQAIAERGYLLIPGRKSDPAFFPLYSVVLHALHAIGLPLLAAGVVFSNLMLLVGMLAVDELGRSFLPTAEARRAAIYVGIFPLGYVFSMLYPQSLVLAAMAVAALGALRGRWTIAIAAAAVAGLTRPEGIFLAFPLIEIARRQWPSLSWPRRRRAAAAVLAAPTAFAAFPLYLGWALHDLNAWSQAQRAWGRSFSPVGPGHAFGELTQVGSRPWLIRDIAFAALYLLLLFAAHRAGVPRGWLLAAACILLVPIASGTFTSDGRFGLIALPIYWGLAAATRHVHIDRTIRILALASLASATYLLPLAFP